MPNPLREVVALEKERQKASDNLSMYGLHPKGLKGLAKFDHMVGLRQREYADKQKEHKISDCLHIHSPKKGWTDGARDLFKIKYHNVLESNVLKSVGNGGNKLYAARARLDNLGSVKSHCCFVNNPERLDRMRKRLQAVESLGEIEQSQKIAKRRKWLSC